MTWTQRAVEARNFPEVWGHRGASRAQRQNSPAAFDQAYEWGAAGVELDIRRTADAQLVVHHDADLEDGRLIIDTPAAELPDYVPTLAWVLERWQDRTVNIEVKSDEGDKDWDPEYPVVDLLADVLAAADESAAPVPHIVTSFDRRVITRMRAVDSDRPTGLITWSPLAGRQLRGLAEDGHVAVMAGSRIARAGFMKKAAEAELFVGVWTVNDVDEMTRLAQLGVHAIMTDLPDLALQTYAPS